MKTTIYGTDVYVSFGWRLLAYARIRVTACQTHMVEFSGTIEWLRIGYSRDCMRVHRMG